ncbi:MAG: putative DNA binding domain-containing protein, partial [Candidatus Methanoperedens sp.]|nr:putative DNA binding domain-containing protein [Candidatus Methanoperedens sp.]
MDIKELEMILKEGEGYKIEFKEGFNNLDKEIVAFANSSGGRIFLGVTDESKIKGIVISNELKSRIQDIANNCRPKIKISIDIFEKIFIINVGEGDDKPYECSAGFYKRLAGFSKSIKSEAILINLGVAKKQDGKIIFNNAGVLFFAKEPQRFIPWSVFTVALFKDYGGADIIDRKEVEGSLFEIVEEVMKFVRLYSKVAYRFTGMPQRENIYEYPFEAIREAVINSVMHKYYFEHGHNNILKFFPDRIKIENYWQEPPNFILGETVFRRNHIIADLFAR